MTFYVLCIMTKHKLIAMSSREGFAQVAHTVTVSAINHNRQLQCLKDKCSVAINCDVGGRPIFCNIKAAEDRTACANLDTCALFNSFILIKFGWVRLGVVMLR